MKDCVVEDIDLHQALSEKINILIMWMKKLYT